jgi:enoyl-CoA hydratase/carnithine racemase
MAHEWDNRKATAQMLGRWQPFHEGHYVLFQEIVKITGQVCIQIRDVQGVDDNPFDFETVKRNIEDKLNPEFEGRFKIMLVPNITNISYGRGVGYKIEEVVLSKEIQKISATKIRAKMREDGNLSNIKIRYFNKDIASIIISEPKTYNALSFKNLKDLIKAFKKLDNDKYIKVIIIEGSGKGFSAGHDLKEVRNLKIRSKYQKLFNLCSKLMLQIVEGKKPVIAKIHGAAFAAGCQLVASCDLAYSTNESIFATPGVNIGLFCSTPMVALSRKINRKRLMKMLLTGEPIKANYAKEIGLINEHFSKSKLNNEVLKVAKTIASKSNLTIKIGKQAFYKQLEMPLRRAYSYTSQMMTANMMAMDAREGVSAFLEKRKPKWKNK